ncbi:MAG: putative Ig domain-containing protein [Pseudomonadota bacterium]
MFAYHDELIASGVLAADQRINVVGHSLGGHLATIFALYRPGAIDEVLTYNGAGTGENGDGAAKIQLDELLGDIPDSLYGGAIPHDRITNLYAEAGPEFTAGTGVLYGDVVALHTEDNGLLGNHSIKYLSDTLAVHQLFEKIQNDVSIGTISSILQASASVTEDRSTLETVLTGLGELFGVGLTWSSDENQLRDNLYKNINTVQGTLSAYNSGLEVTSLAGMDAATLLALANPDVGGAAEYRYAIQQLNPFAVSGNNSLYAGSGSLDWSAFSLDYWNDRSNLLYWKNRSYTESPLERGQDVSLHSYWILPEFEQPVLYRDLRSGYEVKLGSHTGILSASDSAFSKVIFGSLDGAETLTGGKYADRLYGGSHNDTLNGGDDKDYLEGGAGADTLEGGADADVLHGGAGNDTYLFNSGDGLDFILDSDGQGTIKYDGDILTGGDKGSPGIFLSDDEKYTYLFDGEPGEIGALVIRGPDGNIVVNNFKDGDLGISLAGDTPTATPPPDTTLELIGDFEPFDFDPDPDVVEYRTDELGNTIPDPDKPAPLPDTFNGGDGNDYLHGGDKDDVLSGNDGDDHILGGADRDRVQGGDGADLLEGGADTDIITGGAGDDRLYADALSDWDTVFESGNTQPGVDNDWLSGGEGDDLLVGSTGDNGLAGGAGSDLIIGGAGDDNIMGDSDWLASDFDWSYSVQNNKRVFEPITGEQLPPGSDADTIYGGGGNDFIHGQAGDDVIFGNEHDDYLVGNSGSDTLIGGTGDDRIFGDDLSEDAATHGNDLIEGGEGNDTLAGHAGADRISGDAGDDIIYGDGGTSQISLEWHGDDHLSGGEGNDEIHGHGGNDTLLGGAGIDTLYGQEGDDLIYGDNNNDTILGGDGDDRIYAGSGADAVEGGDGNDYIDGGAGSDELTGGEGNDIVAGGDGDDVIYANAGNDTLLGGAGDDQLQGNDGDDTLSGGIGNDAVVGGGGNDRYFYNLGDGIDTFADSSGIDTVRFGAGIDITSASVYLSGGFLIFEFSATDVLYVQDNAVENYVFSNGATLSPADILQHAVYLNGSSGDDQISGSTEDDVFLMSPGDDEFSGGSGDDVYVYNTGDGHDVIHDSAGDIDVLVFGYGVDPAQMTVSKSELDLVIEFSASDSVTISGWFAGQKIEVFDFANGLRLDAFAVEQLSGAPAIVGDATHDILVAGPEDDVIEGAGGDDTLIGGGGDDVFVYGSGDGLDRIETVAGEFNDSVVFGEGIAPKSTIAQYVDNGTEELLQVRFLDPLGRLVEGQGLDIVTRPEGVSPDAAAGFGVESFVFFDGQVKTAAMLVQESVNQTPVLNDSLQDQVGYEDSGFSYTFEMNMFDDPDAVDVLEYSATRTDGSALPGWLSFNPYTREFSGTPVNDDVGSLDINVTATDGRGLMASDTFSITVVNTNDAPEVGTLLEDASVASGQMFDYAIPASAFSDPDINDQLTYAVMLTDGQPLPAWMTYDAATGTLSGTPEDADTGLLELEVTASDMSGATAIQHFSLEILSAEPEPPNVIDGNGGSEVLTGTEGVDYISSKRGDDTIYALGGDDVIDSGRGRDVVYAGSGDDMVLGQRGDDTLLGEAGADTIEGGSGEDVIEGGIGNDVITGGDANDILTGGSGSDAYVFSRGDDKDTVYDFDAADAALPEDQRPVDSVLFGDDIATDQLWFERDTADLLVSIIGTRDQVRVSGWYIDDASQVEEFRTSDGSVLTNARVEQLVAAMAVFREPHFGNTVLPADYQEELQPVIAQAWQ